jgi:hypothetical protein
MRRVEPFEQAYMQALYDEGYRSGFQGYPWMKAPPGLAKKPKLPAPQHRELPDLALSLPD